MIVAKKRFSSFPIAALLALESIFCPGPKALAEGVADREVDLRYTSLSLQGLGTLGGDVLGKSADSYLQKLIPADNYRKLANAWVNYIYKNPSPVTYQVGPEYLGGWTVDHPEFQRLQSLYLRPESAWAGRLARVGGVAAGALVGGALDAGIQYALNGEVDWGQTAARTAGGAVGGAAGLLCGPLAPYCVPAGAVAGSLAAESLFNYYRETVQPQNFTSTLEQPAIDLPTSSIESYDY